MQPKLNDNTSDLSLDGLEGLLDSDNTADVSSATGTTAGGDLAQQDWTVEETARALKLTRGAVIRRLEDGILPGYRVKRSYGWVWRVKPVWLGENAGASNDEISSEHPSSKVQFNKDAAEKATEQQEYVEVFDASDEESSIFPPAIPSASYREMIELKTKLAMTEFQFQDSIAKLETANYRIGYLEARLETSQEQLRMLTDSRREQPWWQRWRQWFTTVSE